MKNILTNSKIGGGQKLNKAFTLIELLAVIIILAVIALIATPIVLNVIENSRKESNKNSTYGILDAAKLYYTESMLDTTKTGVDGKTNLLDSVSITGKRPNSGTLYISDSGLVAIAVVYDNYCFKKEFNETDLTETTTDNCSVTAQSGSSVVTPEPSSNFGGTLVAAIEGQTHKGIVYLNPTDLTAECNENLANANVNSNNKLTGVNTGCMRFYIFDDTGDNYTMILDHNTSGDVAWNLSNSTASMKQVATRLSEDTNGWIGNPRLIEELEIKTITNTVTSQAGEIYFGSGNTTNYSSQTDEQKAVQESYAWLFDNLYQSTNNGGNISDDNQYPTPGANVSKANIKGYWTSTPYSGSANRVWYVGMNGCLSSGDTANRANSYGVRPVITIAKTDLQ